MLNHKYVVSACFASVVGLLSGPALAGGTGGPGNCGSLPTWQQLKSALVSAVNAGGNGGLGFNMWGAIVDNSGIVCAVAFSGADFTAQWLGSRMIAAQKANTGNAFSLAKTSPPAFSLFKTGLALSSANLFSAVQPGGSLYGLQASNPVATEVSYGNQPGIGPIDPPPISASTFGTPQDPLVGERVGGINVFGGGLGLYKGGVRVGGVGVSGDTSCTDHMIAWRTRSNLGFDQLSPVAGVSGDANRPDNIVFDITPNPYGGTGVSKGGFGHPTCINNPDPSTLPPAH
jgi:Haem-degrading